MDYCQEVVVWLQDVIDWMNDDVIPWLNGLWWLFGAQNWAINEIYSLINTLQWWRWWVSENCEEIEEIEAIVSTVIQIIGFVEWIISLF
jgi:hypothetical protein